MNNKNYPEPVEITLHNINQVDIMVSAPDTIHRIVTTAHRLGLGVYCQGGMDDTHLFIGVPDAVDPTWHSPYIAQCQNQFNFLANILELVIIGLGQLDAPALEQACKNTPDGPLLAKIQEIERRLDSLEDKSRREFLDQTNCAEIKQAEKLVSQTIATLSARVKKIRGEIYHFRNSEPNQITYRRWRYLLSETVPPEYKCFHYRSGLYVFCLPQDREQLLSLIKHDEGLFDETYRRRYDNPSNG